MSAVATSPTPGMLARRQLAGAFLLTAAGALLMLVAAGRPWATAIVHQPPPLPDRRLAVSGAALGGVVRALGLLALAGLAALVALRGWARVAAGAVLVACGAAAVLTLGLSAPAHVRNAADVRTQVDTGASVAVAGRSGWPWIYALGGVAVATAGGLTFTRGRRWPGLGARYDAPTARPVRSPDPWTALDRGEDPTLR